MKPECQWFHYLMVQNGLLTPAQCARLRTDCGPDIELVDLAQAVVDRELCQDFDQVQALVDQSYDNAWAGSEPATAGTDSPIKPRDDREAADAVRELDSLDDDAVAAAMEHLLAHCREAGASDLHLSAGSPPFRRRHGVIEWLLDEPLDAHAAERLNTALLDERQRLELAQCLDLTTAVELTNGSRCRVNANLQRDGLSATYHLVPRQIPPLDRLGLANADRINGLLDYHNGLILVTGPAGSGKTTTLAALVDTLNHSRYAHIITIEDPIEVIHTSDLAVISQREVGTHTDSYAAALKGALREDPDVIVIGELHDLDTIRMAVTAAETGHLVLATLHTRDAAATLNRLLGVFPPSQQPQIRAMLAESLRGIVCQQFLPAADGQTRVLASELLIATTAVSNLLREGRTHHLEGVMQTGISDGMVSMDLTVLELCRTNRISRTTAIQHIRSRQVLNRLQDGREHVPAAVPAAGLTGAVPPPLPDDEDARAGTPPRSAADATPP